jgi:hypothetical protein
VEGEKCRKGQAILAQDLALLGTASTEAGVDFEGRVETVWLSLVVRSGTRGSLAVG